MIRVIRYSEYSSPGGACRYSLVWVVQNYSFFVFHYLVSFIVMDLIVASFLV